MVSVCLPSDALLQHLPSYLGFSYLGRGGSLHCCSSKVQPLLLTLDEGYLLIATLPDLQRGIAPPGPPVPAQPRFLGRGVGSPALKHRQLRQAVLSMPERSHPTSEVRGSGREYQTAMAQEQPRGATPGPRPGVAARRSNPTSKERWLRGPRRA